MKVAAKQDNGGFQPVTVSITLESQSEVDVLTAFCGANLTMASTAVEKNVIPAEAEVALAANLAALFDAAKPYLSEA